MTEHRLHGCRPVPLAHYLKALGILRLVAEQADPRARGRWDDDVFVLHTELTREQLERFFLEEYSPTPIVGPWGARSGFYPDNSEKAARAALEQIVASDTKRTRRFSRTIATVHDLLKTMGFLIKEDVKPRKLELLRACRAVLDDDVVPWLDACYVLTGDGRKFPPLLGTGGSEASSGYSSGFSQQVVECIVRRRHDRALISALWDDSTHGATVKQTAGHFMPNAVQVQTKMNPWDYLLCLEGALVFAGALSRRNGSNLDVLAYPFTTRAVTAGYGTAANEKSRGQETWLPLWSSAIRLSELMQLMSEGRSELGRRAVRNSSDFARAVATLGVDRGITEFQRYGFLERNGQSNFATPLNRIETGWRPHVALLGEIDRWLQQFRRHGSDPTAPGSVKRALRALEDNILALCTRADDRRLQAVLIALGQCERALASSLKWTMSKRISPIPPLSAGWRGERERTVERRLAEAFASTAATHGKRYAPTRIHLEPVSVRARSGGIARVDWDEHADRDVVWANGDLIDTMNRIVHRRMVLAQMGGVDAFPDTSRFGVRLADITDFIQGRVDERLLADLIWACALLDWPAIASTGRVGPRVPSGWWPGALYAVLRLCYSPNLRDRHGAPLKVPLVPQIHRLASVGQGAAASRIAVQRLRASGLPSELGPIAVHGYAATRAAAALAFPVHAYATGLLTRRVMLPADDIEQPATTAADMEHRRGQTR